MKAFGSRTGTSTILVVDDQPEVRGVLRRLLERTGRYAVAEADGPQAALAILSDQPPDAVILDLSMPHGSGLSVIPEVLARCATTKIIVLSSHHGMEVEMMAMGADAFLAKTTPPKKVLATLAVVLGR